jgi:toxin ParE1/3/4
MARYRIDENARDDMKRIHRYISKDNPVAARNVVESIRERFRLLAQQPLIGESVEHIAPGLRRSSIGNYVIYFRPKDNWVEISRVLHGAQEAEVQF